ncbi:hypothetical protein G3I40_14320 [Streptomyces sp. SID14478]|uniref:hypothetical protein n=1 Tax=Streptomyces sp. SID14478 TaxID=2706073 RepID=UPI0013DA7183|nr:hypothetical protein [Streptomyces sp. SID14478]NEB76391.1 hypothetical protein [Streptomyces sp. SID14478]
MRTTTVLTVSLLAAGALLTGCGSDKDDAAPAAKGPSSTSSTSDSAPAKKGARHQVKFDVGGTGSTMIMWVGDTNHTEQATLPWPKKQTIQLEDAQIKAGVLVSVVPGSTKGPDGMLKAAPCTITVDGKQVADNDGGNSDKPCEYQLKG